MQLGLGAGDLVVFPQFAYPTYAVGAALAGARALARDSLTSLGPERPALLWLNSPSNPTGGRCHPTTCARSSTGAASAARSWSQTSATWRRLGTEPVSVLHPSICGDSADGLLAVHSLSKRSNLAGYRCAFVAGDARLVGDCRDRKNLGLMMPGPQQSAMAAALSDTAHAKEQHARYAARRAALRAALEPAGFRIDHSEASLYLWTTRDEPCWETVSWPAERGILVAPGDFYGTGGRRRHRRGGLHGDRRRGSMPRSRGWREHRPRRSTAQPPHPDLLVNRDLISPRPADHWGAGHGTWPRPKVTCLASRRAAGC